MKKSKYWNKMVDILEWQFPKGKCKERGAALVMLAYIEMLLLDIKFQLLPNPKYKSRNDNHKNK